MAIGRVRSDPQDKCATCKSPPVVSRKCKDEGMKPMGRKFYKDKTGGKHSRRFFGKRAPW